MDICGALRLKVSRNWPGATLEIGTKWELILGACFLNCLYFSWDNFAVFYILMEKYFWKNFSRYFPIEKKQFVHIFFDIWQLMKMHYIVKMLSEILWLIVKIASGFVHFFQLNGTKIY